MTQRLLLALQPEPGATARIEAAAAWAARLDRPLHLVTVIPAPVAVAPFDPAQAQDNAVGGITTHRNANDWLEGLLPAIPIALRGKAHVLTGRPDVALGDLAGPDDILIVGTHHRTDVMRLFLGSVAERMVREAPCSVLVVGDGTLHPPERGPLSVRIPIDVHEPNGAALNWLAQHTNCELTAVYVMPWLRVFGPLPGTGHQLYQDATRTLKTALQSIGHAETHAVVLVREEMNVGEALAHEAQEAGAHLIALPTHSRSGLARAILGSVAERTVRAATTAVLVVR